MADRVLLAHMRDCLDRILEYTNAERSCFDASRLVQDAVIRNLQILAESSQRLSNDIKGTEPQIPWRELAGFRNVIVHVTWESPCRAGHEAPSQTQARSCVRSVRFRPDTVMLPITSPATPVPGGLLPQASRAAKSARRR